MTQGKVKWFNNAKGYGFIEPDEAVDQDIFVHYSAIEQEGYKTLREGDVVSYELNVGPKGPAAQNVSRVHAE